MKIKLENVALALLIVVMLSFTYLEHTRLESFKSFKIEYTNKFKIDSIYNTNITKLQVKLIGVNKIIDSCTVEYYAFPHETNKKLIFDFISYRSRINKQILDLKLKHYNNK